ncbi:DUF4430 domain-containing protein [Streptomyces sp. RKAG337]|uniref:DUF4430 domain-containing protein n=1 Tax=Streptomyces sp. RKAG337 TaxID=2893404 RepID=UPI0020334A0A|nr:DUF4430 domain-containing protein [Streptomyces sp. RKAG337]MCM2430187.1 DUF4430 domain-containing protein [Streptomyces sp. RKAG337]
MLRTASRRIALAAAALAFTAIAPSASAASATPATAASLPVLVRVTVVDTTHTVFNGIVLTNGHDVTTATGGTHRCDGTNGGANPGRVATPTAALDDAARRAHFSWDGTWYPSFDDYAVSRIAADTAGASEYWNISVNGTPTPVGGCQFRIRTGDKVVFTLTAF